MPRRVGILPVFIGRRFFLGRGRSPLRPDPTPLYPVGTTDGRRNRNLGSCRQPSLTRLKNLSMAEITESFSLVSAVHWPNGRRITLVMMEPGPTPKRAAVLRLDLPDERKVISKITSARPISRAKSLCHPRLWQLPWGVSANSYLTCPGLLVYVRATDVDASVKVIRVGLKRPSRRKRGYKLHIPPRPSK